MGEKINLSVKKSRIAGAGIVRIHKDAAGKLGIKSGGMVEVWKGGKWIIAEAVPDKIIGKNSISLRAGDMKSLSAEENDKVGVSKHIPVKETAKKEIEKLKKSGKTVSEKIKKGATELKKSIRKKLTKKTKAKK
ncbi:MAG: hypothetical protein KJ655_00780 [Candidatus Thermoplasmatota archaeon]|nr:hypothetical protein [Candidatus Thermoplasmatota archaeon]